MTRGGGVRLGQPVMHGLSVGGYVYPLSPRKVQYRKRYYRVLYKFRPMGRRTTSPGVHNLKEHVQ